MVREYESASSIVRFLGCPHSYKLKYVDKIVPSYKQCKKNMDFGGEVHRWMEKIGNNRDYTGVPDIIRPYIESLHKYLDEDDDEIIMTEWEMIFKLNNKNIKLIIDAITKKGKALEYKITKSPQWYETQLSYQLRIYSLALQQASIDAQPVYLLFENKENKETGEFEFKKLHPHYPATTDIQKDTWKMEINQYITFIDDCHHYGIFPPTLINCGRCEYKADCENYSGF